MDKVVDCRGMACPLPVITSKKAIAEFTEDGTMTVLVDNDIAVQNLTRLADHNGFAVHSAKKAEKEYEVVMQVTVGGGEAAPEPQEGWTCLPDARRKDLVVVLSSDRMGSGDEALGKKLMNAFIFALTSQDAVPDKIICYNMGAYLTTENEKAIEDLKSLEAAGATVMTCGTCLDYYGLKEKLQVGIISNMYDIVEAQMQAGTIIRP
ncbi:MAG: sulfurtransferase-like selenium metabolism protein YedF [Lachnospiraceae bacterium]|nr:sulfurtransferase-like selenium metabolism protein YedF [Lachnospiraceae bacterium]